MTPQTCQSDGVHQLNLPSKFDVNRTYTFENIGIQKMAFLALSLFSPSPSPSSPSPSPSPLISPDPDDQF